MHHGATWLHASGSLIPLRSDGFLFESLRVPLLELRDQLLLLIIDRLLGELGLALKLLKLLISLTVLLLELFQLSEPLKLLLVDHFSLLPVIHIVEAVGLRGESRVHLLGQSVTLFLFVFPIQEAFYRVDLALYRINRLSLGAELDALSLEGRAALDDLLLDACGRLRDLELTESRLFVNRWTPLSVRILLFTHASQHCVFFLLLHELILGLNLLLPLLHGCNLGLFLL